MAMKSRLAIALVLAASGAGVLAQAQAPGAPVPQAPEQPPVTFKVEVNLVEVDAFVTDAQGNPAPGPTAADFELLEDGKPQRFPPSRSSTSRSSGPSARSSPRRPSSPTCDEPGGGRPDLSDPSDDLHTDFSRTPRVKTALRQFINQNFGSTTRPPLCTLSGRIDASQDFTSSPRLLLASIDMFAGRKNRSSTLERIDELYRQLSSGQDNITKVLDPLEMERGFQARSTMTSVRKLAEFIGNVHGRRKAMIFVSEGIDYNVLDVFNNTNASAVLDETRRRSPRPHAPT